MENNKKNGEFDTAVYSLWFGLNYGSILTAFALYKVLEQLGKTPIMLPKPKNLWTDHYADKNNISGLFIYENCRVLESPYNEEAQTFLNDSNTVHVAGSDLIWNRGLLGKYVEYFMLRGVDAEQTKISVSSSFGNAYRLLEKDNEFFHYLRRFKSVSVSDRHNANIIKQYFGLEANIVLDPIFLCDKNIFIDCAEKSAAKKNERSNSFIFASIENGDSRKKNFVLRANNVMLHNKGSLLRCMIDINRFPESKKALGIDPAYFIRVDDYLYYLINSEIVFTDNVYAMYMAILFEKPFAVLANKDDPDLYRFKDFLEPLGLSERIVILQDDLKTKEYLFRKPVRYQKVNAMLKNIKEENLNWLKNALGIEDVGNNTESAEQEEM